MGAGKAGFFGSKVQNGLLGFNETLHADQSYGMKSYQESNLYQGCHRWWRFQPS